MPTGEFIRAKRKELGLTASALAKKSHLAVTTISRLERDTMPPPREYNIVSIAKALDIEPDLLFAKFNKPPQELTDLYCKNPRYRPLLRALDTLSKEDFDSIFDIVMQKTKNL